MPVGLSTQTWTDLNVNIISSEDGLRHEYGHYHGHCNGVGHGHELCNGHGHEYGYGRLIDVVLDMDMNRT